MALEKYNIALGAIEDENGKNYISGKAVYIRNKDTNALINIYQDQAGNMPIPQNGVNNVSDNVGMFSFWVEAGRYKAVIDAIDYYISVLGIEYFQNEADAAVAQAVANFQPAFDDFLDDSQSTFDSYMASLAITGQQEVDQLVADLTASGNAQFAAAISAFNANGNSAISSFNSDGSAAIQTLKGSQGFYDVGTFEAGFIYEKFNDVGRDANGNPWVYIGDESNYPVTVAAGTDPSAFPALYAQRGYNDHAALANRTSEDAHPSISITNSDGLTAQDTHDALKATLIAQGLSGNYGFFEKGFTYNEVGDVGIATDGGMWTYAGSESLPVNVAEGAVPSEPDYEIFEGLKTEFTTVEEAVNYRFIDKLLGKRVYLEEREGYFNIVLTSSVDSDGTGFESLQSEVDSDYSFELEEQESRMLNPVKLGAKLDKDVDSTDYVKRAYALCGIKGYNFYLPTAQGDNGVVVSDTIPIPLGVKTYAGPFGSSYASPNIYNGARFLIKVSSTLDVFTVTGSKLNGCNVSFNGVQFRSHSSVASLDLSSQTINCVKLFGCFTPQFNACTFEHLNVTNAVTSDSETNVVKITNCHAGLIGDTTGALKDLTGGWTYGNAYNLQAAADSTVSNSYAEFCGDSGVRLASNSKLLNSFIDLNGTGLIFTGSNHVIKGNSIKFSQRRAVIANADAKDWIIDNCIIKYNNYQNASGTVDDTFAIRLTSGNTGWTISNINSIDSLVEGHPDKTKLQNFIHLGSAGNSGTINNVKIGDTAVSGARFFDPNGNIANGLVELDEITIEGSENNKAGLSLTNSAISDIGKLSVSGDSTSKALTLTTDSIVTGLVRSKSCGTLVNAGKSCLAPKVMTDVRPDSIITKVGGVNGGAVAIRGFSFKVPVSTSDGGTVNIATMPDRFTGDIFIASGNSGAVSFMLSARVVWDGLTLTVTDGVTHTSSFTAVSLIDNAGDLAVSLTDGGTYNQDMVVDFNGYWIEV